MTSLLLLEDGRRPSLLGPVPATAPAATPQRRRRPALRPGVLVAWAALLLLSPFLAHSLGIVNVEAATSRLAARSVATSGDDVRAPERGGLVIDEAVAYIGAGDGERPNIAGFRFANLRVPPGAIIVAANFSLVKVDNAWNPLRLDLAFEAGDSAASFSEQRPPGTRATTGAVARVSEDRQLFDGTRYVVGDAAQLAASLQEVIDRPGWREGNSVALIAFGPPDPAWTRMAFATYDAGSDRAPQLSVTYRLPKPEGK